MALRAVTTNGVAITPSSVSLPTGGTFDLYNTADQTTNYERLRMDWLSNVAQIYTAPGGTGTTRQLKIGYTSVAGGNTPTGYIHFANGTSFVAVVGSTSAAAGPFTQLAQYTNNAGSGTQTAVSITPTYNQSGTAGATILNVDPIVTATGSGTYLVQRWGWNGGILGQINQNGNLRALTFITPGTYAFEASYSAGIDLTLARDAADTLALRRTTNAQTFRVYKTYTDASNYERLDIGWSGSQCFIGAAYAGTGSGRELQFVSYGSAAFTLTATAHMALAAGTTARSQINFASSTAPTSPADGDLWFDGTNLKLRVSGTTYTLTKV